MAAVSVCAANILFLSMTICWKGIDNLRVELMTRFLYYDFDCLVLVKSFTIGPVRCHGIESIGYGNDPRHGMNAVSRFPVRVSLAIVSFVVFFHCPDYIPGML